MIRIQKPIKPPSNSKESLKQLYNHKCGYCEQYQEELHIEHYRPKSLYAWLSDSWDNLLISCPLCNYKKSNKFPTRNSKVAYSEAFTKRNHSCGKIYDRIEKPLILNPEREINFERHFEYTINGEVIGKTPEGLETISVCDLNREHLIIARKQEIEQLKDKIKGTNDVKKVISDFIQTIRRPTPSINNQFIAYRKYILKYFLKELY